MKSTAEGCLKMISDALKDYKDDTKRQEAKNMIYNTVTTEEQLLDALTKLPKDTPVAEPKDTTTEIKPDAEQ